MVRNIHDLKKRQYNAKGKLNSLQLYSSRICSSTAQLLPFFLTLNNLFPSETQLERALPRMLTLSYSSHVSQWFQSPQRTFWYLILRYSASTHRHILLPTPPLHPSVFFFARSRYLFIFLLFLLLFPKYHTSCFTNPALCTMYKVKPSLQVVLYFTLVNH